MLSRGSAALVAVIRFASISGDYRWRVGPEEALAVLRG
jgi:hypothetical protein